MRERKRKKLGTELVARGTFARVNKNFPNRQVVPKEKEHTPTKRDRLVQYALINESQRRDSPRVEFQSQRAALKLFGLGTGGVQHIALRQTFARLSRLKFRGEWYVPVRNGEHIHDPDDWDEVDALAEKLDITPREARRLMRKQNRQARYRKRNMRYLRGVRRHLDGRLAVVLDDKFFRANHVKRHFVKVYLDDIKRLSTAPQIELFILLRAWKPGEDLVRTKVALSERIGLYDSNLPRWRQRLIAAVRAIEEVRDGAVDVYERRDGKIVLTPQEWRTGERGEHSLWGRERQRRRRDARAVRQQLALETDDDGAVV